MARIPPLTRFQAEDFTGQSEWIEKLIGPLNRFMELTSGALNKQLTLEDNMAATVKTVDIDGIFPVKVQWSLPFKPVSVVVGNVYRADGAPYTMPGAVSVAWSFNSGYLSIDNVLGVVPAPRTCGEYGNNAVYVDTAAETLLIPGHGFATGDKVTFTSTGTPPTGLTSGSSYFVIKSTADKIKLATTYDYAIAGTAVNLTGVGVGPHLLTPVIYKRLKLVLEIKGG